MKEQPHFRRPLPESGCEMKNAAIWAVLAIAGVLACGTLGTANPRALSAERSLTNQASGTGGLLTHAVSIGEARQQLTVIDPQMRVVSVYHIDSASGEIALKSVRNIHWDLQMVEFNASSPAPREIRALLEQR